MTILEDPNLSSFHRRINQPVSLNGDKPELKLRASEIYKELRLRGYDYGPSFQGILESNQAGKRTSAFVIHLLLPPLIFMCLVRLTPGDQGTLQWTGNWVTFLDTMLQMLVVGLPGRSLRLPTRIRSVCVDPVVHLQKVCRSADGGEGT